MSVSNRGTMMFTLTNWLNRRNDPDFAAASAGFLLLTEERIATSVRARSMVVRATYPVSGQYLPLPCDWLEFLDVRVQGCRHPLPFASRLEPAAYDRGGAPLVYRLVDGQMEVLPVQDPMNPNPPILEIAYYARPAPMELDTDSTALLVAHPSVYLFIAAMFAAMYINDAELLAQYNDLAASAVLQANEWQEQSRFSGARLNAMARAF